MPKVDQLSLQIKAFCDLSPHELYAILNLRGEVFAMEQGIHYLDTDGKDQRALHLLTRAPQEPQKVIAYARLFSRSKGFTQNSIGRVCVAKSYRGQGLAKELMLRSIEALSSLHKSEKTDIKNEPLLLGIIAQNYLVDFYRSLGFRTTSDVYLHNGVDHIDMVWTP